MERKRTRSIERNSATEALERRDASLLIKKYSTMIEEECCTCLAVARAERGPSFLNGQTRFVSHEMLIKTYRSNIFFIHTTQNMGLNLQESEQIYCLSS